METETWQGIKLTALTKQLLNKYCRETKERPEDVVQKALEQLLEKQQPAEAKQETIEYESVTLRVPKKIMDFMRSAPQNYPGPVEWLEYSIVDQVRADLEATTGQEMIEWFGLAPIFRAILNDKRFS